MAEEPLPPSQISLEENEQAEVFSISQDKDGLWRFTRRNFLYFSIAAGGTLLLKGICPRFGASSASTQPAQAGTIPLPGVYLHTEPRIDSNIVDTLQPNDIVLLVSDHPDLGWVEVATRAGQQGWLNRRFVDFSRAFTRSSRDFGLSDAKTPTPTLTLTPAAMPIQSDGKAIYQTKDFVAEQAQSCGEAILNGDFEAGPVTWVEVSSGKIIVNNYPNPYQGSWVAWMGGTNAQEKLTQRFHLPADVQDVQTLLWSLKVTTEETGSSVYDTLVVRFLDASGRPITPNDIKIANNTTPMGWSRWSIQLGGWTTFANQDIQIQFEAVTNSSKSTDFIIDSVSLNLACVPPTPTNTPTRTGTPTKTPTKTPTPTTTAYVYLPIIVKPKPTPTPTKTPIPISTSTPCPSHVNPCPSDNPPCSCDVYPCACNSYPNPCTCYSYPCSCNTYIPPCSCDWVP